MVSEYMYEIQTVFAHFYLLYTDTIKHPGINGVRANHGTLDVTAVHV